MCDKPCGKVLSCVIHKCQRVCHSDPCQSADNQKCTQKCSIKRRDCQHLCNAPCHGNTNCPTKTCQEIIKVKCPCGNLQKIINCSIKDKQLNDENSDVDQLNLINPFMKVNSSNLTSPVKKFKIQIDNALRARQLQQQQLKCEDECLAIQENNKLTEAFSIDLDKFIDKPLQLPTIYTEFLCDYAKRNLEFVQTIENQLKELVEIVKNDHVFMQCYTFPRMDFNQRLFLIKLATHYGIKTDSVGIEPNRNISVCSSYNLSTIPLITLSETINKQ